MEGAYSNGVSNPEGVDLRRMRLPLRQRIVCCALLCGTTALSGSAAAQLQLSPPPPSMGQPDLVRIHWGLTAGHDFEKNEVTGRAFIGITPQGIAPHLGINLFNAEFAAGVRGTSFDSRIGLYLQLIFTRIGGVYRLNDRQMDVGLGVQFPLRRGGLLHRGDLLRIDYLPGAKEVQAGVVFNRPFRRYRPQRPFKGHVSIPDGDDLDTDGAPLWDELALHLAHIDGLVRDLDAVVTPRFRFGEEFEASAHAFEAALAGRRLADIEADYHASVEHAFALATDHATYGQQLATRAEALVFQYVLVPYNRTFGDQRKPHVPKGDMQAADAAFAQELATMPLSEAARAASRGVFRRLLRAIGDTAERAEERWEQSRLVWLPLNYGLQPHQYDTQAEWDAILAQLLDQPLSEHNTVRYILNDEFYRELEELILDTDTYQVTIIHDFRDRHSDGTTDFTGWDVVVDGYIAAFAQAVDAIDAGTRQQLPEYTLFIDQHFYQENGSRRLLRFLENLYDADVPDIPDSTTQAWVAEAIEDLRQRLRNSPTLGSLSPQDLRDRIKVHVNVTNVADPSFPFDVLMRDHRKLAFRDVFEEDPGAGIGIFTGQGIGDHYTGPDWEDRSMVLQGPALLHLKRTAERLFRSQGYDADEVPLHLQPRPLPADYEQRCRALRERGWTTPAFVVTNDTGHGDKKCTVMKAATMNLARPGSVLFTFDSLWVSDYWASMSIVAALRGAHMYPVAPAPDNAPSAALPTMVLMRENLNMMMQAATRYAAAIAAEQGRLRIGLYAHDMSVADANRRAAAFLNGRRQYAFLREEFPIHPTVLAALEEAASRAPAVEDTAAPTTPAAQADEDSTVVQPYLHLKTQFFANAAGMQLLSGPYWTQAVRAYMQVRERQVAGEISEGITPHLLHQRHADPEATEQAPDGAGQLGEGDSVDDYLQDLPEHQFEKVILQVAVGSFNQDRRSMLLNGEVMLAVSGVDALITLPDFMFILGTARWPADAAQLNTIFPDQEIPGAMRRYFRTLQDLI